MGKCMREESPKVYTPINQSPAKSLRPKLSYMGLKKICFRIRSSALCSTSFSFYSTRIAVGVFSDIEGCIEQQLDLNEYVGGNSSTIFCI